MVSDYLMYSAVRIASGLLAILPYRVATALGRLGGRVAHILNRKKAGMAARHMRRAAPGREPGELARDLYAEYGRYWSEILWIRPRRVPGLVRGTEVHGLEHIKAAQERKTGMILALPHLGNWEAAIPFATSVGLDIVGVAEHLENDPLREWFTGVRNELGAEVLFPDRMGRVWAELKDAVSEGRTAALISDRDLKRKGVEVEFFGEKTTLPPGPVTLSITADVPVLTVGTFFRPGTGHRIQIDPPLDIPTVGSLEERVAAGTQALASRFENLIAQEPSQWHLLQPNWPSDPGYRR